MTQQDDFRIIGDWGTSRLRLYRIVDRKIVGSLEGPGIAVLSCTPEQALREAIAPWVREFAPASITLCGMVGSRNGWTEVEYVECPADAAAWRRRSAQIPFGSSKVTIMAGLACTNRVGAPDVMRGEETQVFGALALEPQLLQGRQLVILPGTHSKWAWVEDGCITDFQTFPTGELFALLRDHSILTRVAAPHGKDGSADEEQDGFRQGLERAREGELLGSLFEARSAQLRRGCSADWGLGFLSGLLLGREIAEATARGQFGEALVIGEPRLAARYCEALRTFGMVGKPLNGDACACAGLLLAGDRDDD